jgi:CRP-like cAMP-binding protein
VIGASLPLLAVATRGRLVALDRRLGLRDDEIGVLRGAPMLRLLPVPTIEHLASRLRRRVVAAGTSVFEQGDTGEGFYVVADGEAEVIGDGAVVRMLGPGDSFGEIALLHEVPRTATIRALTDLAVFELDGDSFLDAVGGFGASSDAAYAVVSRHLANFRPAGLGI